MRVCVFGAVRLVDGNDVDQIPPSPSQRRILALLAANLGQPLRGERICDLLEISPGTLRTTISGIRKFLTVDVIVNDAAGYRLDVEATDATELEAVARSVDQADPDNAVLRRGKALEAVAGAPYEEFAQEPWARSEVTRLEELRAELVEAQASSLFVLDRHDEGVQLMSAHVASYPYRDQARAILMEGLARTGRQVEALRAYEEYRAFLDEDAGAVPSPELQALSNEIAIGEMSTTVGAVGAADVVDVGDSSTDLTIDQDLVAYLVTDLVGSTQLRVELGDRVATPLIAAIEDLQRAGVAARGGTVVQGTGDGVIAWFTSVTAAIDTMLDVAAEVAELGTQRDLDLALRAAVDVGDVDWIDERPEGPMTQRCDALLDDLKGAYTVCAELAAVLAASGAFEFEPGPGEGLLRPRRLLEPAS